MLLPYVNIACLWRCDSEPR